MIKNYNEWKEHLVGNAILESANNSEFLNFIDKFKKLKILKYYKIDYWIDAGKWTVVVENFIDNVMDNNGHIAARIEGTLTPFKVDNVFADISSNSNDLFSFYNDGEDINGVKDDFKGTEYEEFMKGYSDIGFLTNLGILDFNDSDAEYSNEAAEILEDGLEWSEVWDGPVTIDNLLSEDDDNPLHGDNLNGDELIITYRIPSGRIGKYPNLKTRWKIA